MHASAAGAAIAASVSAAAIPSAVATAVASAALAAAAISTPFPAFDDSDVLTESDFNLFDADHTSQDAL